MPGEDNVLSTVVRMIGLLFRPDVVLTFLILSSEVYLLAAGGHTRLHSGDTEPKYVIIQDRRIQPANHRGIQPTMYEHCFCADSTLFRIIN
jgi:hypothetical protein